MIPCTISIDVLKKQNAETSNAVIDWLEHDPAFQALAAYEGHWTVVRDRQDDEKLQAGIDFAKHKGVIDPKFQPEPYLQIDVLGQTPEQVADTILTSVQTTTATTTSAASNHGTVIVLVGLSGTGKGTTVAKLVQKLEAAGSSVVTWSNGNIFRSVTLLAAVWCEQNCEGGVFDKDKALTTENLASFMSMLSFGKHPVTGVYDTHIQGLGLDLWVSEIQNTDLKEPKVSKNIPTVAEVTQGEVILFAAGAVETMGADGLVVLLEGREQTVNYVRTPHRFALTLSDESLIGKRRAAQRVMAAAIADESMLMESCSDEAVGVALRKALNEMKDI